MRLGENGDFTDITQLAITNLPVLLVLIIACMNVGTLVYARTATRDGEIALRTALGANRARIVGQLFIEALVLALAAAAAGLIAAQQTLAWGIDFASAGRGGAPFWMTPDLKLTTILYAGGLAAVAATMLSVLPALRATRAHVQSHLVNLGIGGATLRFGAIWTTAMIAQVTLTTIAIPIAGESADQARRKVTMRAEFPSRQYLAARLDLDRSAGEEASSAFEDRRARRYAELEWRIAQEPNVVAVTFADRAPGAGPRTRVADVEVSPGGPAYDDLFWTSEVGPGFFEAFDRPIIAGRGFHGGDQSPEARTVIVNEAFARRFQLAAGRPSPIGARLRYSAAAARGDASVMEPWFEIVGVVRNLGLDPEDRGPCCEEAPYVYHAASAGTVAPLVMMVRVRGNPAPLAARVPTMAAGVDAGLYVQDAQPLDAWVGRRNTALIVTLGALAAITLLALFLSALGIFSLMSVSVSRRTREIGLRAALGADPRHVVAEVLARAIVLVGCGIAAGGALLLPFVAQWDEGIAYYAGSFGITAAVMLAACLLACIGPARRALRINPTDALREA